MISHVHESGTTNTKPPRKFEAGTCNLGDEAGLVEAIRYVEKIGFDKIDRLEDCSALAGVAKVPARVKCAVLAWHTLEEALNQP